MAASVPCPSASGAQVYTIQPLKMPPKAGSRKRIGRLKGVLEGVKRRCSPAGEGAAEQAKRRIGDITGFRRGRGPRLSFRPKVRAGLDWLEFSVTADGEAAEAIVELFNRFGQGGAVIEMPVDCFEHELPSTPLPRRVNVKTYLPLDVTAGGIRRRLEEGFDPETSLPLA